MKKITAIILLSCILMCIICTTALAEGSFTLNSALTDKDGEETAETVSVGDKVYLTVKVEIPYASEYSEYISEQDELILSIIGLTDINIEKVELLHCTEQSCTMITKASDLNPNENTVVLGFGYSGSIIFSGIVDESGTIEAELTYIGDTVLSSTVELTIENSTETETATVSENEPVTTAEVEEEAMTATPKTGARSTVAISAALLLISFSMLYVRRLCR